MPKGRPVEDVALEIKRFNSVDSIKEALRVSDVPQLTVNLVALRNQWTIRHGEPSPISPDDERLTLAKNYLAQSPTANELFKAWELLSKQSIIHQHLALGVFSSLLNLLSSQYIYHPLGLPVLKALLDTQWTRRLNAHLNSAQTDLVLVALKLWNSMVDYAGGVDKRRVFEEFAWGNKSLFRLFNMRRKGQVDLSVSPFLKPDIRTLYITFILRFIQPTSTLHFIKSTFLESHRDIFLAIFKRLYEDPYLLVRTVLEACWEGIWQDNRLKKTLKIGLFGEKTLNLLIKLYTRTTAETSDPESIPADLIHHFLLALCTRPGIGLCFKDNGWYPRQEEDEVAVAEDDLEDPDTRRVYGDAQRRDSGKTYNRIIGHLLKSLRPTEDARHQELTMKIFQACPELVYGYWSSSRLAMEPRLSSKWLINIAWVGSIISLPIPLSCFYLPGVELKVSTTPSVLIRREYNPTPPPLVSILSNILPSLWSKTLITKGLQNTSPIVQRATALCLAQSLEKYELVLRAFRDVEDALEEEVEGRWKSRRREMEKEMKKRFPNFEVIVAFSQVKSAVDSAASQWGTTDLAESDKVLKNAMLSECALRLMWLYHRSLPEMPAEARYDVGKLLLSGGGRRLVDFSSKRISLTSSAAGEAGDGVIGFDVLSQLHILRLLQHSDQFIWHATLGETNQTHLYHLLHLYVLPLPQILSKHCGKLIQSVLSPSVLFEHDPSEPLLWLEALPRGIRASDAKGPNGEELVDERETMIAILDKCIRECIKSPWKYVERAVGIYMQPSTDTSDAKEPEHFGGYGPSFAASPLLMTLVDFFKGVLKGEPALPPSAALAMATYLRRLLVGISLKQPNIHYVLRVLSTLDQHPANYVEGSGATSRSSAMLQSIRREFAMLRHALLRMECPEDAVVLDDDEAVVAFLNHAENLAVEENKRATTAYDLIDWIRLSGHRVTSESARRILKVIGAWYPAALPDAILQLDPSHTPVASVLQSCGHLQDAPFTWAYLHCSTEDLANGAIIDDLSVNMAHGSTSGTRAMFAMLLRRLESSVDGAKLDETVVKYTCTLWAKAIVKVEDIEKRKLYQHVVFEAPCIQAILHNDAIATETRQAVSLFVGSFLSPLDDTSCLLARDICGYWVSKVRNGDQIPTLVPFLLPWIAFMTAEELQQVLDLLVTTMTEKSGGGCEDLVSTLHAVLHTLQNAPGDDDASLVSNRIIRLLNLWELHPENEFLSRFISSQMSTFVAFGVGQGSASDESASGWSNAVEKRWKLARKQLSKPVIELILKLLGDKKQGAVDMLAPCLYKSTLIRQQLAASLLHEDSQPKRSTASLQCLIDASIPEDRYLPELCQQFSLVVVKRALHSTRQRKTNTYGRTLHQLFRLCPDKRTLSSILTRQYLKTEDISSVIVVNEVAQAGFLTSSEIGTVLTGSIGRMIALLGDATTNEPDRSSVMNALACLGRQCSMPLEIDDALFTICARDYLAEPSVMEIFAVLVKLSHLKPATANRLIQAFIHHPRFEMIALSSARDALISALYCLFQTHPQNTCQLTHVSPLIAIYRGTLSVPDRQLLDVFRLFEQSRKYSCSSIISQWSPTPNVPRTGVMSSITNLDTGVLFATSTNFPQWRAIDAEPLPNTKIESHEGLYDPLFIILLLGLVNQAEGATLTISGMDWVQLFRSNTVCVLVSCLSSRQASMRALAWSIFGGLLLAIQDAEFQEQRQTVYMLGMLSRLYASTTVKPAEPSKLGQLHISDAVPRLASFTTLFFAHAVRALYSPASTLYPLTSRFLLQRPDFDPQDPPMLYSMLYSTLESGFGRKEGNWKRERNWMLRFLADGMVGSKDWMVLQRRRTWDLLATTFQGNRDDKPLVLAISKVLLKMSYNWMAATSLVDRSNLYSWLEIQTQQVDSALSDESVMDTWFQILENLIVTMDVDRVESRTRGAWRGHCVRCLEGLLRSLRTSSTERSIAISISSILTASRTLLRLAELPYSTPSLTRGLHACLDTLQHVEKGFSLRGLDEVIRRDWVELQLRLWAVMMKANSSDRSLAECFDSLTARIVGLHSVSHKNVDAEIAHCIEWVREQTLRTYGSDSAF